MTIEESYKKFFSSRAFERADLLRQLTEKYGLASALYPGSYTHVTPSFFIPNVIYVDSDPMAKKIFRKHSEIESFVEKHKTYSAKPIITFFGQSYSEPLPIKKKVDFLFSQYAGPISQACKQYLKKGGILVANNSHADAGIAFLDPTYKLIAVANNRGDKASISVDNLSEYFIPKKEAKNLGQLITSGKGIGYTKTADNFIFKKILS